MIQIRPVSLLLGIVAALFFVLSSPIFGDDGNSASLADVHKILLQAAGYDSDMRPTTGKQIKLLNQALKEIQNIPHVYHGELNDATRFINAALSELSNGDPANKARGEIFSADDKIKSIL